MRREEANCGRIFCWIITAVVVILAVIPYLSSLYSKESGSPTLSPKEEREMYRSSGMSWDTPLPAPHCHSYDKREFSVLNNINSLIVTFFFVRRIQSRAYQHPERIRLEQSLQIHPHYDSRSNHRAARRMRMQCAPLITRLDTGDYSSGKPVWKMAGQQSTRLQALLGSFSETWLVFEYNF